MFFETPIMENTADLAMVQKTIIDTLHKEGKSQRAIAERMAVHRVLYQSILNAKLTGRKTNWVGKEYCQAKPIQTFGRASQGVNWVTGISASRVTTLRHLQEKGYQATSESWMKGSSCSVWQAAIKATCASITLEQCHRLIASMPHRIDAVIHAKGGPTKYWVHRNEHTFQKPDISV